MLTVAYDENRGGHKLGTVGTPGTGQQLYVSLKLHSTQLQQSDTVGMNPYEATIGTTTYRRLEPDYLAWICARMAVAQARSRLPAGDAAHLEAGGWQALRQRFATIWAWAVDAWGIEAATACVRRPGAERYDPPHNESVWDRSIPYIPPPAPVSAECRAWCNSLARKGGRKKT